MAALVLLVVYASANAQPDTIWTRNFKLIQSDPTGLRLTTASDGGYFFGGDWHDPRDMHGWTQSILTRTDSLGRSIWQRTFRFAQRHQYFGGVIEALDGGVLVAARGENNYIDLAMIYKLDQNGDSVWCNFYGAGDFNDITIGADGLAVVVGSTFEFSEFGRADAYVVKIDENGEVIWRRVFGGNDDENFKRILPTPDDGFILVGATGMFGNGAQGWLMKVDSEGRRQWSKGYGGQEGELFYAVALTSDSGYLAGGCSVIPREDGFANFRNFLVKTDGNGDTLWTRIFDNPITPNEDDYTFGLANSPDGGYLSVGTGSWTRGIRPAILRFSEDGDMIWHLDVGESRGGVFHDVLPTPDGGYLIGGEGLWAPGGAFLVRVGPDSTALNSVTLLDPIFPSQFVVGAPYPNPFDNSVQLSYSLPRSSQTSIRIYNQLGKQVAELYNGRLQAGQHSLNWDGHGQNSGTYFIRVNAGTKMATQKVTLVK